MKDGKPRGAPGCQPDKNSIKAAQGGRFLLVIFSIMTILTSVPRKVRQLIADLEGAGFVNRGGKGSHRNFEHSKGQRVTVSGRPGDDARHYQEKQVAKAIKDSRK